MRHRPLLAVGLALTVLGVALLTWVLQRDAEAIQAATTPAAQRPTTSPSSAVPSSSELRIRIPEIGLDHVMHGERVSADGTIDPEPGTVMWFEGFERVRPGDIGTAVIAGHVSTGERPDVFADLADVDVGDTVQISDGGASTGYRVVRASAINKEEVTSDPAVWGSNASGSRLAIITCDDAFGFRRDGHRVANYVVIAERS
jgi:LPXTG-site transpeptidase (sortase) family protein